MITMIWTKKKKRIDDNRKARKGLVAERMSLRELERGHTSRDKTDIDSKYSEANKRCYSRAIKRRAGGRARKDRHGELDLNGLLDLDVLHLCAAFRGDSFVSFSSSRVGGDDVLGGLWSYTYI